MGCAVYFVYVIAKPTLYNHIQKYKNRAKSYSELTKRSWRGQVLKNHVYGQLLNHSLWRMGI